MRILHIGKYYPPYFGGIEKVNFDLVESLNQFGYQTDELCFNHQPKSIHENRGYNIFRTSILTAAFSSPLSISIFRKLREIYKNYDIIHLHVPNPMGAIALQLVPFKGKVILHWHSDIIKQKTLKKFYKPLQDKLLKRADHIIVTSPNYLDGSDDLKPYRNKCTIVPIGISSSEFAINKGFQIKLDEKYRNRKVIFSIGRLIYYKGFEYLIEAAKELPDEYVVLIGGTGILADSLQNQINENNLQNKVILLGKVPFDQLGEYYRRADVYCLPSTERSEAFGVVLIEAMSWGCPIVATNISGSGVPWVNINNETGLCVEPKNPQKLAKAITEILEDETVRNNFSRNALLRFDSEFQLDKMTQRTIQLYESLFR